MKQIRKNVFETNSSSTHSIAIPNHKFRDYPNVIHFGFGEFGWETKERRNPADYLYTSIYAFYSDTDEREEKLSQLKSALDYYDIRYTFEEPRINSWGDIQGYVDHAGDLDEFLTAVFSDDETLLNFVFFGEVFTSNDNGGCPSGFLERGEKMVDDWDSYGKIENPYYEERYEKDFDWYYKQN